MTSTDKMLTYFQGKRYAHFIKIYFNIKLMNGGQSVVQKDRLIGQFIELVRVDSETKHERQICDLLKSRWGELGVQVTEDDSAERSGHGAGNLIVNLPASPGAEAAPVIYFTCHMDTVAPGRGIQPQIGDDGYIRSDGTTILGSDDKAGIAALLEAVRVLQESGEPHGRVQFIITVGEEAGLNGARALDRQWLEAEYGYALDCDGRVGSICVAAPTQAKIRIEIRGKSAHAGLNPEDGISAIQVAARAISRMPLGRIDPDTTANIGSFSGGGATNIVCDRVVLEAEARSLYEHKLEEQLIAMKRACESAANEFGATAHFTSDSLYSAFRHDEQTPVVQLASRAIAKIGRQTSLFQSGGGSDANIFNGMGVPTVNLAVGYEQIHTTSERMPIEELVKTAELVVAIIQEATQRAT